MDDSMPRQPAELTVTLDATAFADDEDERDAVVTLTTEWALWGKDEQRTNLHVMRHSKGALSGDDFAEIFNRYATGVKEGLPQYTACWIPANGPQHPAYLAVGIHELADPGLDDGRTPYVGGRQVEYIRLFCFRYDDVARLGLSYTDLLASVRREPLRASQVEPLQVKLATAGDAPAATGRGLAAAVATLLLTRQPVCVLDADGVDADSRLAFIDEVMSLLPFGLRATLSASTWASPTARDLKLRLFFSTARRNSGGRTCYVSWAHPEQAPSWQSANADLYSEWLRQASAPAIADLARMAGPVRFTEAEIGQLVPSLPRNKSLAETLADLHDSLQAHDQRGVSVALTPLKLNRKRPVEAADRVVYKSLAEQYQLFADFPWLHHSTQASLYRTLLGLAFGDQVSYDSYCRIERAAGGKIGARLQKVLLSSRFPVLPFVLAANAAPGYSAEKVMADLAHAGFRPENVLDKLEQQVDLTASHHLLTLDDFAVRYLMAYNEDPQRELKARGYLSGFFARAYPAHDRAYTDLHQRKLVGVLQQVYGEGQLTPRQVSEIFAQPRLYLEGPITGVVKVLSPRNLWRHVDTEAECAYLVQTGSVAEAARRREASRRRPPLTRLLPRRASASAPRTAPPVRQPVADSQTLLLAVIAVIVLITLFLIMRILGAASCGYQVRPGSGRQHEPRPLFNRPHAGHAGGQSASPERTRGTASWVTSAPSSATRQRSATRRCSATRSARTSTGQSPPSPTASPSSTSPLACVTPTRS